MTHEVELITMIWDHLLFYSNNELALQQMENSGLISIEQFHGIVFSILSLYF
jgi:hypothetical protein